MILAMIIEDNPEDVAHLQKPLLELQVSRGNLWAPVFQGQAEVCCHITGLIMSDIGKL